MENNEYIEMDKGDIVSFKDFPLATGGVAYKFAIVMNQPSNFGGDAILIELTTNGNNEYNKIVEKEISDQRRTSPDPYICPRNLQIKETYAQISRRRNYIIWGCLENSVQTRIIDRAWSILQQSK